MSDLLEILSSNEIVFHMLFNNISRFMRPHTKYITNIMDYNGKEPFIATLCVGLISCLRTFDTAEDKKVQTINLLDQYISSLRRYKYKPKNHANKSWFSFLKWNKTTLSTIPRETIYARIPEFVRNVYLNDYYENQEATYHLFNDGLTSTKYHAEYNNYMTFIITAFCSSLYQQNYEVMERFVKNFVDFHIEDKICIYDNYETIKTYSV